MYGEDRRLRYLIGFGLVAVLLVIVIILIMTSGSGKPPAARHALTDYAGDDTISISEKIVGPVVANQNHAEATITINNSSAMVTKTWGYGDTEIASAQYPMSQASFTEFLAALDRAGFTKGNTDESLADDKGYCATGERYIFTIKQGSQTLERFWATNCGGVKTYRGALGLTQTLFASQIPDYDAIVGGSQNDNANLVL